MLQRLDLNRFRNYHHERFEPGPGFNLVVGENGSGKTSLLEAIYLLGSGRSFRGGNPRTLIQDGEDSATVFAELSEPDGLSHRIGMERDVGGIRMLRLDGENAGSLSEVARVFPVQVFHPNTVALVEGGPGNRRRYLDWGLFHVEQSFQAAFRNFTGALKQRNMLLKKSGVQAREIGVWDRQVASASGRIDQLRRAYLERLEPALNRTLERLGPLPPIRISLYAGWAREADLLAQLEADRQRDQLRGFTGKGAHRADLRLATDAGPVREVFSRGQTKTLAYGMILAQLEILTEQRQRPCLVLVDDLGSELDDTHRHGILDRLSELGQQTIFTALPADRHLLDRTGRETRMFHVEHGALKPVRD